MEGKGPEEVLVSLAQDGCWQPQEALERVVSYRQEIGQASGTSAGHQVGSRQRLIMGRAGGHTVD